jgi:SAM-dependent methyltransferase
VCAGQSTAYDVVDLNRSCNDAGEMRAMSGTAVYYYRCAQCGFCHAPALCEWTLEEFAARIYNDDYVLVDPDYVELRPRINADALVKSLGQDAAVRHLDYGGGHGLLSDMLRDAGWDSRSYDPFVDRGVDVDSLGVYDLVTAYEVFEHVPDVQALMRCLSRLVRQDGLLIFSTLVSDGEIQPGKRLTWWYAAPRNGHISLFTRESLARLADTHGFRFGSFSPDLHVFWRVKPAWARALLGGD